MPPRKGKSNARGIRRYDDGGSVDSSSSSSSGSSGSTGSASSGMGTYYNMMSRMRGNLGGSGDAPYAAGKGGNAYFSKGGKVRRTVKRGRK